MSATDDPFADRRATHDVGGLAAGEVLGEPHELDLWEKRVDAVRVLLGDAKRRMLRADELRRCIEELPPETYDALGYYQRWALAISNFCIEKELFTRAELEEALARRRMLAGEP